MRCSLLALPLCSAASAGPVEALTIDAYFFEMSDRERGAYVTGFIDLFGNDAARDPEYRECVGALGADGLHRALSESVRDDPRLLGHDAAQWLLFESSRACNRAGVPPPPAARSVPDSGGAPQPVVAMEQQPVLMSGIDRARSEDRGGLALILLGAGAAGAVAGIAVPFVFHSVRSRRRAGGEAGPRGTV